MSSQHGANCSASIEQSSGDQRYSYRKNAIADNGESSIGSCPTKKEKFANGIFTFLHKFRASGRSKTFYEDREFLQHQFAFSDDQQFDVARRRWRPWPSIESVLSTATTHSFSFIPADKLSVTNNPNQFQIYPKQLDPADCSELSPYAKRLLRNSAELDRALTLRTKYNLHRTNSAPRRRSARQNKTSRGHSICSGADVYESGSSHHGNCRKSSTSERQVASKQAHSRYRRAISEVTSPSFCHRPGKRKAPPPPAKVKTSECVPLTNSGHRKKRKAPQPPPTSSSVKEGNSSVGNRAGRYLRSSSMEVSRSETISNDSLKLERGYLRSNKVTSPVDGKTDDSANSSVNGSPTSVIPPVSPKPWYKRTARSFEQRSSRFGINFERKKAADSVLDDWMLESGLPRSSSLYDKHRCSMLTNSGIINGSKGSDEKRKSQVSMLANISELDREAAEIIQSEKRKEREIALAANDRFYSKCDEAITDGAVKSVNGSSLPATPPSSVNGNSNNSMPKKNTARELISLFNAITNVTKVTVNSSFFASNSKDPFGFISKKPNHQQRWSKRGSVATKDNEPLSRTSPTPPSASLSNIVSDVIYADEEEAEDANRHVSTGSEYSNRGSLRKSRSDTFSREQLTASQKSTSSFEQQTKEKSDARLEKTFSKYGKPFSNWTCPQCTLENASWKFICEACHKWRPYSVSISTSSTKLNESALAGSAEKDAATAAAEETFSSTINADDSSNQSRVRCRRTVFGDFLPEKKSFTEEEKTSSQRTQPLIIANEAEKSSEQLQHHRNSSVTAGTENCDKVANEMNRINARRTLNENESVASVPSIAADAKPNKIRKETNSKAALNGEKENSNGKLKKEIISANRKTAINEMPENDFRQREKPANSRIENEMNNLDREAAAESRKKPSTKNLPNSNISDRAVVRAPPSSGTRKSQILDTAESSGNVDGYDAAKKKAANMTKVYDLEEQQKLKDILRELKNSLPKKKTARAENFKLQETKMNQLNGVKKVNSSADKKTHSPMVNCSTSNESDSAKPLIRKLPLTKPTDVYKTKAYFVKGNDSSFTPDGIGAQRVIIKDDVLYTSKAKETNSDTTNSGGIYQLIRPRDFDIRTYASKYEVTAASTSSASCSNGNGQKKNRTSIDSITDQLNQLKLLTDSKYGVLNGYKNSNRDKQNTIAINRLLRKLQTSIASGQHHEAANLARELARLKVNCNVTRLSPSNSRTPQPQFITLKMYIEDRVSQQGPLSLTVSPEMTLAQLKNKIYKEYEIPVSVQKWILGKHLANDDLQTLDELGINVDGFTAFLYLVAPEKVNGRLMQSSTTTTTADVAVNVSKNEDNASVKAEEVANASVPGPSKVIVANNSKNNLIKRGNKTGLLAESSNNAVDDVSSDEDNINVNVKERNISSKVVTADEKKLSKNGWICEQCTLINETKNESCAVCLTRRPKDCQPASDVGTGIDQPTVTDVIADEQIKKKREENKLANYQELVYLENADLVSNTSEFDCSICLTEYDPGQGVILRDCLHIFCRECLAQTIQLTTEAVVKCPYRDDSYACDSVLQEREIKALVTAEVYEKYLTRSITEAENKIQNAFHCKTANCQGWCIYEDNVNQFLCPVCNYTNCLTCQAIHTELNCKQYQELVNQESVTNEDARSTKNMLQEMLSNGEAMTCPTCEVILMKKLGCDWLRCSMCKTEICWVTRGPRWGPTGRGDVSGGCRCGVNGVKCHPRCTYCH